MYSPKVPLKIADLRKVSPTVVHAIVALYSEAVRLGHAAEAKKQFDRLQSLYPQLRKRHLSQMYLRYRNAAHQAAAAERIAFAEAIPD